MKLNKFAAIQGAFLSIQKTIKSLNTIDFGDKESLDFVNEKICKVVKSEEFENEDLQRLFLLLFLNTNSELYQKFKCDEKCSHLVGYIPMISRHLLTKLMFGLKLEEFLCNSITFIEGKICYELLSISEIYVKMLDEFEAVDFVKKVANAVYKKLLFCDDSYVKHFFHTWLKHFDQPSDDRLTSIQKWNMTKVYHFTGLLMFSLLSLLHEFLELFSKNEQEKPKTHVFFEMFENLESKTVSANKSTLLECCNLLISKCTNNMIAVTLDIYLYWAEIDLDDVPDTENTLQRKICEKAYKCNEALIEAEKLGVFSSQISDLINYLKSIASKPHDNEGCEESEVDVSTIIKNIQDSESETTEWLNKLFKTSFEFTDDIVKVLVDNVMFIDPNSRTDLWKKSVKFADMNAKNSEYVKQLALKIVNLEKLDVQVKFLEDYIQEYGLKKILVLNNFDDLCIDTFNKVVNNETKCKEMYPNFISLAMQDGETVIRFAVKHAINCELQGQLMADILNLISSVCCITTKDSELNLLLVTVKNAFQEVVKMPDFCQNYFVLFVNELVKRNLIDGSILINTILPLMNVTKMTGHSSEVTVHSLGLDLITSLVGLGVKVNNSVLLAMSVDVLHENRCYVQYCCEMMAVCEKAIGLIDMLVNDCVQNTKNISESERLWLKDSVKHHTKMNAEHLARLFPEETIPPDDLVQKLFYMMHRGTEKWSILDLDDETKSSISLALYSLLASLTRSEWEKMFCMFAPDNAHFIELFKIISDAILILKNTLDSFNSADSGQVCLEYCIRTVAYIISETIGLWDDLNQEGTAFVFVRFCYMMTWLSKTNQEESSSTLLETLTKFLKIICENKPIEGCVEDLITTGILCLSVVRVKNAIASTLVEIMYGKRNEN